MGNPCYVIQGVQIEQGGFFDAFYWTYLLALGEFNYGDFEGTAEIHWLWFMFVVSTIILNLGFTNIVITFMGSAYEEVQEQKSLYQLDVLPDVYSQFYIYTYCGCFNLKMPRECYVYSINFNDEKEEDEWGGGIQAIKKLLNKN